MINGEILMAKECDVCKNSDVQTTERDGLNVCDVCVSMEAKPDTEEYGDDACKYDPLGDKYYKDKKHVVIQVLGGEKMDTRTELIEYLKEQRTNIS